MKPLVASFATEFLGISVDYSVFLEVGLLVEGQFAEVALVRSFCRVSAQMVEEVVPVFEHFATEGVLAVEELQGLLQAWFATMDDHKLLSGWHMLVYLHFGQVEVFSCLDN